jgi:hypothetical protein
MIKLFNFFRLSLRVSHVISNGLDVLYVFPSWYWIKISFNLWLKSIFLENMLSISKYIYFLLKSFFIIIFNRRGLMS